MPTRCVVGGCDNIITPRIRLHRWPRNTNIGRIWTKFVQRTRADWTEGPKPHSVICSDHFSADCYLQNFVATSLGIKPKLKDSSVPTILPKTSTEVSPNSRVHFGVDNAKPERTAFKKREFSRMFNEAAEAIESPRKEQRTEELPHLEDDYVLEPNTFAVNDVKTTSHKQTQADIKPKIRSKYVETTAVITRDTATQCQLMEAPPLQRLTSLPDDASDMDSHSVCDTMDTESVFDPDDCTDVCSDDSHPIDVTTLPPKPASDQKIFLVYEENLLNLFSLCPVCQNPCARCIDSVFGSMISVRQQCPACHYHRKWDSQPLINRTPAGNIMLSSALLFSGACVSKTLRIFNHMNISVITHQTFLNHQNHYLQPAVMDLWKKTQASLFSTTQSNEKQLVVAGDGRCDSPGHSAKYGSYTLMDTSTRKVLHMELVTVTEVANSNQMEKEGLKRALDFLGSESVSIDCLVTDRHVSIRKFVRENHPAIDHRLDVWHIAKGILKKLNALGKQKGMQDVLQWKKSIINHLHWCATSTPDGNPDMLLAKWDSLIGHMQNQHHHDNPLFPACLHGPLEDRESRPIWLTPNSAVCERLMDILNTTSMRKDIAMMSTSGQTSNLEAFHSVLNHFAPKLTCFSPSGMMSRLQVAAIHFNENSEREQALTLDGRPRFNVAFKKFGHGQASVKKVLTPNTFSYVTELKELVLQLVFDDKKCLEKRPGPQTMTSKVRNGSTLTKEDYVRMHQSRYKED